MSELGEILEASEEHSRHQPAITKMSTITGRSSLLSVACRPVHVGYSLEDNVVFFPPHGTGARTDTFIVKSDSFSTRDKRRRSFACSFGSGKKL
jgi:hypothetical protein